MRLFFLFLLLVNGLIYLWYTVNKNPVEASPTRFEASAPALVLLSELPPDELVTAPVQPDTSEPLAMMDSAIAPSLPERSCYTLGPFMNNDDMAKAAETLMLAGRPIEKRTSEKKEQIGYWVFMPPFNSREEAVSKGEELKLLGEKHLYVVKSPEKYRNAISLGVFKGHENAKRRFSQLKNLGYDVRLEGRYRQNPVYWLDYSEQEESNEVALEQFVGAQRHVRPCETVASNVPLP